MGWEHMAQRHLMFRRMAWPDLLGQARREIQRVAYRQHVQCPHIVPVRVFKRGQYRQVFTVRVGRYYVAAYTWRRLAEKIAMMQWKKVQGSQLEKRWK